MWVSDGVEARIGTLTADREWFMPWRTIEGEELADTKLPQLQVVLEGVFEKRRFLDLSPVRPCPPGLFPLRRAWSAGA
jgi:type I restriction enzyme R subunit